MAPGNSSAATLSQAPLAIRCPGEITRERLDVLRQADAMSTWRRPAARAPRRGGRGPALFRDSYNTRLVHVEAADVLLRELDAVADAETKRKTMGPL